MIPPEQSGVLQVRKPSTAIWGAIRSSFSRAPAVELISASGDSDLVAVGSLGGGGFAKLMLGSVSSQVVHRAACSVGW
jgi:nucleotide-binding universal stress UspA family protein